jgi:hypothetical protein
MNIEIAAVSAIAGGALSGALELIPGVRQWWEKRSAEVKSAIVCGLCIGTPFVVSGLACGNVDVGLGATCLAYGNVQQNIFDLLFIGGSAFVGANASYAFFNKKLGESLQRASASRGGVG